jgi:hypothetical protein
MTHMGYVQAKYEPIFRFSCEGSVGRDENKLKLFFEVLKNACGGEHTIFLIISKLGHFYREFHTKWPRLIWHIRRSPRPVRSAGGRLSVDFYTNSYSSALQSH